MDERDDDKDPVSEGLSDFANEASNYVPEVDPGEPRDPVWLRWSKFAALIIFPAMVFGLGFMFVDYVAQYRGGINDYPRIHAEKRVKHDTVWSMKVRFEVGAAIGGGLGLIYVVRCIVRKVDP